MISKTLFAKLLMITCAGGILIGHCLIHQFSIPAETALRLSEAGLMVEGAQPYVSFYDNATPFYLDLNLVPVMISRATFFHPIVITNLLTALFFMLSAGALALLSEVLPPRRNALSESIWAILVTFILVTLLQPVHFAQANQIFFLALCPYIACRACTVRGARVPHELAFALGAALSIAAVMDPLYCLFVLALELCILFGFFPFSHGLFLLRRYLGAELKTFVTLLTILLLSWLLTPNPSTYAYVSVVTRLNYYSFCDALDALRFMGLASDSRQLIYLAALLLAVAMSAARQSIFVRIYGIAAILGLGLMIIQGGALLYQSYLLVGFAALACASGLTRQPLLRRLYLWRFLRSKLTLPVLPIDKRLFLPVSGLFLIVFGLSTYWLEWGRLKPGDRFDLTQLGYYGLADKRDLSIFAEEIQQFSAPRQPVGMLSLGVRPAYPLLTQLRRKPGLSLTWGFPIDTLNILQERGFTQETQPLKSFKKEIYDKMTRELAAKSGAPVVVLIDEDEPRRAMEDQGVLKVLEDHYKSVGSACILEHSSITGHPPVEYVGYKTPLGIYLHK